MISFAKLLPGEILQYGNPTIIKPEHVTFAFRAREYPVDDELPHTSPFIKLLVSGCIADIAAMVTSAPSLLHQKLHFDFMPLHFAVRRGDEAIVLFLLHAGADLEARTRDGRHCAHIAWQCGHYQLLELLLSRCSSLPGDLLFETIEANDTVGFQLVLAAVVAHRLDLDCFDEADESDCVLQAARIGNVVMLQALLHNGFDMPHLIHCALAQRNEACIDVLLAHDSTLASKEDRGHVYPVMVAAALGYTGSLRALLKCSDCESLDAMSTRSHGQLSLLQLAVLSGNSECVSMVVTNSNIEAHASEYSALSLACALPNPVPDIVLILCKFGANVNRACCTSQTPLHLARRSESVSAVLGSFGATRIADYSSCTLGNGERTFMRQQFWMCNQCNLVDNLGVCFVCVEKCHAGHEGVSLLHLFEPFYCDCQCCTTNCEV
jgi:hypothetical protein